VVTLAAESRDPAHPTHIAAAVHQSTVPSYQFRSHFPSGTALPWSATSTGAAENADSFHAAIHKSRFRQMMEIRVFGGRRRHFGRVTRSRAWARLVLARCRNIHVGCYQRGATRHEPRSATIICLSTRKDGAINMIRKLALRFAVAALLALMALNAYLAINRLSQIQKSAALTLGSSMIQANISGVLQDLTDMETGQRGYLLTGDPEYLKPYAEGKIRIKTHFAGLRSGLANQTERERSLESQLESLASSKQSEMERTISLRQEGYRHRAFKLVDTNEGRDYMDGARGLASSLSLTQSSSFAKFDKEWTASLSKALSETIVANFCLLVLAACLFAFIRYHGYVLEKDAAESRQALAVRDSELEKLTSALSNQARSKMTAIEENVRLLLEEYGGFLPRHGHECAEQIKEAAAQMERLRRELLGHPGFNQTDQKAA
jgi:CHASE3 domain sensor protein